MLLTVRQCDIIKILLFFVPMPGTKLKPLEFPDRSVLLFIRSLLSITPEFRLMRGPRWVGGDPETSPWDPVSTKTKHMVRELELSALPLCTRHLWGGVRVEG